jgi:hypothetical protein
MEYGVFVEDFKRQADRCPPSSARLDLGSVLAVSKQDLQFKLTVRLRLNLFNGEPNSTRKRGVPEQWKTP